METLFMYAIILLTSFREIVSMDNFLSKKASSIKPYTAGAQPTGSSVIKLNTNENPYPPSPKTLEAYNNFDATKLRLYPNTKGGDLRRSIANLYGLDESYVFCGNGSDEVLALAFNAFFDDDIIFPDITYSFYPVWSDLYEISYKTIPLNDDFTIPVDKLIGKGVVLANPNAPTGIALGLSDIEKVLKQNPDNVVIVDEAYAIFGAQSASPLIPEYKNLLIISTLSKSHALAGMRLGYAIGQPHLIEGLERMKDSFNSYPLDAVAQRIGSAAIDDKEYYSEIAQKIINTRERFSKKLKELEFTVPDSKANFVFVGRPGMSAAKLKGFLEQNNIYVRHWNAPRISEYLRISIGTDEQMDILLSKIEDYLRGQSL
jgi:histidinol-phosphate aminotransferase